MRPCLLVLVAFRSSCEGLLLPPLLRIRAPVTRRALTLFQMISKGAEQSADTTSRSQESEAKARTITIALSPIDPVPSLTLLILVFVALQVAHIGGVEVEQGKVLVELTSAVKVLDAKFSQNQSTFSSLGTLFALVPASFGIFFTLTSSALDKLKRGNDSTTAP